MNRAFTSILSTTVLTLLVAPSAHAIRPELLPKYSQLPEGVEQLHAMPTHSMPSETSPEKSPTESMMQPDSMVQSDSMMPSAGMMRSQPRSQTVPEDSFESFEQFYRDRFGY